MRAGLDSLFLRRLSISGAIADWIQRGPRRPKRKSVNGVKKVPANFEMFRRSKRLRLQLTAAGFLSKGQARLARKEFMVRKCTSKVLFWCAIVAQVIGAQLIIWYGRPLYQRLVTGATNLGSAKDYALGFTAILIMQVGYWFAYRLQPHLRFRRNVLVGHLVCCVGEVSFLFYCCSGHRRSPRSLA